MNCKPGDMAIVINANPKNTDCIGRVVTILRAVPGFPHMWFVEFAGRLPLSLNPNFAHACVDKALRPVSGLTDTRWTDTRSTIKRPVQS